MKRLLRLFGIKSQHIQYPSLAETMQRLSSIPIPDHWVCYRSKVALCELWYPADSKFDLGEHMILRPTFEELVYETETHILYTPAITLVVGKGGEQDVAHIFATFGNYLGNQFRKFQMLTQEQFQFRGSQAACYRFLFKRVSTTWEASMLCLPVYGKLFLIDASGRENDISKHHDKLEAVIATFRAFPNSKEFKSAAPAKM